MQVFQLTSPDLIMKSCLFYFLFCFFNWFIEIQERYTGFSFRKKFTCLAVKNDTTVNHCCVWYNLVTLQPKINFLLSNRSTFEHICTGTLKWVSFIILPQENCLIMYHYDKKKSFSWKYKMFCRFFPFFHNIQKEIDLFWQEVSFVSFDQSRNSNLHAKQ